MSERAGTISIEAMLLTRDMEVVSLVTAFIAQLKTQADTIDSAFLDRILSLRVESRAPPAAPSRVKVQSLHCRVWFVSTIPLTDEQDQMLEANEQWQKGKSKAESELVGSESDVYSIQYGGNSRFKREAAPGDIVIDCVNTSVGSRKRYHVYKPMTILHAIDDGKKRHFYLEDTEPDEEGMVWTDFVKLMGRIKATAPKPTSSIELTGNATRILQLMK